VEIDNKTSGKAEWVHDENGSFFSFNPPQDINGKIVLGIKPLPGQIQVIEEIEKKIRENAEREREMLIDEFKKNPPKEIYIGIGGDSNKLYVSVMDEKFERIKDSKEFSDWIKLTEKALEKILYSSNSLEEFKEKLNVKKSNINTALYNILYDDGNWGIIDLNNQLIQNTLNEIIQQQKRSEEEKIRQNNEAIEKAKKFNKEVYIRRVGFYEGKGEEGMVVIWEVATPDGKIIKKHIPTY